jgi:hypothetical protein
MQMFDPELLKPPGEPGSFKPIGQMLYFLSETRPAEPAGRAKRGQAFERP